ncbi:ABC transporter substrate-binding protein [Staphylococcus lutrae]|uniref:Nitrate ABC transporter substrate-binding protein n=1 Tax=Staphylococcus lutrae TaxID=155085 RepID=A0AAC9WIY0_9STAP|nr:ABC transporter substrate-binding protein [Staphylococcus lutrae]ARJ50744.1 nitrate ABC transporter substrate-binding protein [Staphylococcus lutrae]PNZ37865.1 nitrate ABC transporter substrate-binding protein [Staphylococcus lutrae]
MKKILPLLLICLISITGCSNPHASNSREHTPKVIKIGYLPITHAANLMMTQTINEKNSSSHYQIQLVRFNNWPDLMDALNSGRIDGASTLIELAMKAKSKGAPIKAVALGHHEGNVVIGQNGQQLDDFHPNKDYAFAIPHRYSTHYLLLEQMRHKLNIPEGHFHYHEMAPAEMPAALNEQRISGYSVAEPFGALGEKLGQGHLLQHGSDLIPDAYCCVLVLQENLLQQHRQAVNDLMHDYKTAGYDMTNQQKSVDLMAHYLKQDRKILERSAQWTTYGDLTIEQSGYQAIAHDVAAHHLFDPPSFNNFVDPTFYQKG